MILFCMFILILGVFLAGHLWGYHSGWLDGYWTPHPLDADGCDSIRRPQA